MIGRNAHLGHDLADALADRFDIVLLDLFLGQIGMFFGAQLLQRFEREIGIDRFRAITCQHAIMMHFARFAGFHHQPGLHAQALAGQMMMHRCGGEQGREWHTVGAMCAVGQDQDIAVLQHGLSCRPAHFPDRQLNAFDARTGIPSHVDSLGSEGAIQSLFD